MHTKPLCETQREIRGDKTVEQIGEQLYASNRRPDQRPGHSGYRTNRRVQT